MADQSAVLAEKRRSQFAILRELSVSAVYCSAFPLFVLGTLAATKFIGTGPIPRYDAVLFACIAFQLAMLLFRMETPREFAVIFLFHAMGTALEMFKVLVGHYAIIPLYEAEVRLLFLSSSSFRRRSCSFFNSSSFFFSSTTDIGTGPSPTD